MRCVLLLSAAVLTSAAAASGPVKIVRNSDALQFTYEWPAQAAAIPPLDRKFRAEAARQYRRHLTLGREDKKLYVEQQRGSVSDFYLKRWSIAGETPRLLSLQYEHSTYTGGAHPNTDYGALLWDRGAGRQLTVAGLFVRATALPALTRTAYCARLKRERLKRRNGETMSLADFHACPAYSALTIAPADADADGRFDAIDFVASPYVAGPYAEGAYTVTVPVTSRLIAALKPQYRSSFEVQRQ